jgi:hypothetical protein
VHCGQHVWPGGGGGGGGGGGALGLHGGQERGHGLGQRVLEGGVIRREHPVDAVDPAGGGGGARHVVPRHQHRHRAAQGLGGGAGAQGGGLQLALLLLRHHQAGQLRAAAAIQGDPAGAGCGAAGTVARH